MGIIALVIATGVGETQIMMTAKNRQRRVRVMTNEDMSMGVYIKGMKMPKEPDEMIEIAIFGDGKVIQTGESWRSPENGKCYYTITTPEKFFNAVPVPPHGRLIDSDALVRELNSIRASFGSANGLVEGGLNIAVSTVNGRPTIIEKEEI